MSGKQYVFNHHLYEYRKGLRNLVLFTTTADMYPAVVRKLNKYEIAYFVRSVTNNKVNVFFGHRDCVDAVNRMTADGLDRLTPEEDFILGVLLGYDPLKQCRRYLELAESIPAGAIA